MNDIFDSPEITYSRLSEAAHDSRRKRSLEALNEICRLLHDRRSSDFSYRSIVTLGKDRGLKVPSEKSIVNSTGAHYRELIHAWKLASAPKKTSYSQGDWVQNITDPVLRMSVLLMAKELRAFKAKESRKNLHSGAPIMLGGLEKLTIDSHLEMNGAEILALKAAINPTSLKLQGLTIGSRGEINDSYGRQILKPGFYTAIEKILIGR